MNVLPDTSAWSMLLRRRPAAGSPEPREASVLRQAIESQERVFLLGVVCQEVLQGVRSEAQRSDLTRRLAPFPMIQPERATYERAAALWDRCARGGATVSTVDVLIAQAALDHDCALLTDDGDFMLIAQHAPLRLL